MKQLNIYKCSHCNTLIELIDGTIVPKCCGGDMEHLKPNTVDAAHEKHKPIAKRNDDEIIVSVGDVEHPMTDEHYIRYIWVSFDNKVGRAQLDPTDKPQAVFHCPGEGPAEVYEYCTLHGLWKAEV